MKKILSITLSLILLFGLTSCNNWLDVNTDPDNPNNTSATVDNRLPWIQHYFMYAWGTASMRSSTIAGIMTQTSLTSSNGKLSAWDPYQSSSTTMYQNWFVGAACNINDMIDKAEAEGAYHYIGAACVLHAMGFMLMEDLYGEMPYENEELGIHEAISNSLTPAYSDGETIFKGCLLKLDEAIKYFNMTQEDGATPLSEGDSWNSGDVSKWLKLCYGLKARWLNKASKKSAYYDPDEILDALSKAPQSNSDNIIMKHYNSGNQDENILIGDPYQTSVIWDCSAWGSTQRLTRYYVDLLSNMNGSGVIDPRLSKMVPARMANIQINDKGEAVSYIWKRDKGVDVMNGTRRVYSALATATIATATVTKTYTISNAADRQAIVDELGSEFNITVSGDQLTIVYPVGSPYVSSTDYHQICDIDYVNMRSLSVTQTNGRAENNTYYYYNTTTPVVFGTGSFFARPDSDSDILTYYEMCFIKAEVLFREGKTAEAYTAYKNGIQASFDRIQTKLAEWQSESVENPDQLPMSTSDITAYMNSAAVCQSAASLTLADIMQQKVIAMGISCETWNDMRRYNYSTGNISSFGVVYPGYVRPAEFTATNKITGSTPTDETYWFRRLAQCSHETNYNATEVAKSNKYALDFDHGAIYCQPVWWDEDE